MPSPAAAPTNLRIDGRRPLAHEGRAVVVAASPTPRVSWQLPRSAAPTKAELAVRTASGELLYTDTAEGANPWHRLQTAVSDHDDLRVEVRIFTADSGWSPWSLPLRLEAGPWSLAAWGGKWVSHPAPVTLRREFQLAASSQRARLHLTAQGLVRATVNGTAVNPEASDPSRTDLTRALYRTYDVTDLLITGDNVLDLDIGHGEWARTKSPPRVLASIMTEDNHGVRTLHATGEGMLFAPSVVVHDEPFYLEAHDHVAPITFAVPDALDILSGEESVSPQLPNAILPDPGPGIRVVERLDTTEVARAAHRSFDVGTNIAGRSRLELLTPLPIGTVITLRHGEHLTPDGQVDTTNLNMPFDRGRGRQELRFAVHGTAGEVLTPWFCYHGFRYVEVTGLPVDAEVKVFADVLHSDVEAISAMTTDDFAVEELDRRARRTFLNNLHGIPEDCPTREQSGWTGDVASAIDFSFAAFDLEAALGKWLDDLATSQQASGAIPAIAPDIRPTPTPADPVWGAALPDVLENHWLHYGDPAVLGRLLPVLRRWAEFLLTCRGPDGTVDGAPISYGHDWLALEQTPPEILHTAITQRTLDTLMRLEAASGDTHGLVAHWEARVSELRSAGRAAFVGAGDGSALSIGNGSQASLALSIEAGWLTADEAHDAGARIAADIRQRGDRFASGFAGTRAVVRALAATGQSETIARTLLQAEAPGIGAMLTSGPGTLWECWWIDPQNTGTGSLDHVGLGGPVAGWVWRHLVGVRPTAPGFAEFEVEPHFMRGSRALSARIRTIRGDLTVNYLPQDDTVEIEIDAPPTIKGRLLLPAGRAEDIRPGISRFRAEILANSAPTPVAIRRTLSADVDRTENLLLASTGAVETIHPAAGELDEISVSPLGLNCMPVPHEQYGTPTLTVRGRASPTGELLVRIPIGKQLRHARFVYALLDFCDAPEFQPSEIVLRVVQSGGRVSETRHRVWPAGWQRVSVALDESADLASVQEVVVGATFPGTALSGEPSAASFHVGPLGWSTLRRTWP